MQVIWGGPKVDYSFSIVGVREVKVDEDREVEPDSLISSYRKDELRIDVPEKKIIVSYAADCEAFRGDQGGEMYASGGRFFVTGKELLRSGTPSAQRANVIPFFLGNAVQFLCEERTTGIASSAKCMYEV